MRNIHTAAALLILLAVAGGRAEAALARDACREDALRFCADVEPGKGRVIKCLAGHREELSSDCRDALRKLRERRPEPERKAAQ